MAQKIQLWVSPSLRLHLNRRCSGNGRPQETKQRWLGPRALVEYVEGGKVCRCARTAVDAYLAEHLPAEKPNAVVTVTYGAHSASFALDGLELSEVAQRDGSIHRYLSNASRGFVSDEVEKALLKLAEEAR